MLKTMNEKITSEEYLLLYTDMVFVQYVLHFCGHQIHDTVFSIPASP